MMQYIIEQIEDKYDTYLSEDEIALIYEVIDVIYETRFRSAREFANMIKSGEIPTRTLPNGKREIIRDKYHISLLENKRQKKQAENLFKYHFIDKFLLNAPNREATTIANNWIGKNALWNKISSVGDAIGAKAASMGDAIGAKAASMGDAIGAKIGSMSPYIDQISNLPGIFS